MTSSHIPDKADASLLESLHEDEVLALDLVSALAGDRPLTESEAVLGRRDCDDCLHGGLCDE